MEKKVQINLWYLLLALFSILLFQQWWINAQQVEVIPYSEFERQLKDEKIAEIFVHQSYIEGRLKQPLPDGREAFYTTRIDPPLADHLSQYKVKYTAVVDSTFLRDVLSWILPVGFFYLLWMFVVRRMAEKQGFGGLMSVGKSKAKVYVEKNTGVTFDDVAGVEEAKEELEELINFLKNPQRYGRLGAHIPKECFWWVRPAPVRPCWRVPSPEKPEYLFFPSVAPNSSRCSWV